MFVDQPFGNEDCVVVALSENEGCQDDVHQIELDVRQLHDSQNPKPADGHRQERDQTQFEASEREPQEQKNDYSARPADVVEIGGQSV